MESLIDPERVHDIMSDSLYRSDEITPGVTPEDAVIAEGIMAKVGFNPERLESHRAEVEAMLQNLPIQFRPPDVGGGAGWSFLNLCNDANGTLWTGMQQTMDMLVTLGIGLGLVAFMLPREMWPVLPGGMPYVGVLV